MSPSLGNTPETTTLASEAAQAKTHIPFPLRQTRLECDVQSGGVSVHAASQVAFVHDAQGCLLHMLDVVFAICTYQLYQYNKPNDHFD